jgi:hypothetical protein
MSSVYYFIHTENSEGISHNVPVVCDVFASPIKETVGFQGLQKCGCNEPWERSDLGEWNPEPPTGRRSAYNPVMCSTARSSLFYLLYFFI